MSLAFQQLHPLYVAEVTGVSLASPLDEEKLNEIRSGLDQYAVLILRNQPLTDTEQAAFTSRLGGEKLHKGEVTTGLVTRKFDLSAELSNIPLKISNLDEENEIVERSDQRRMTKIGNRIWHNDGCVTDPPAHYTLLSGRIVPPVRADTQFSDTRAAYDALEDRMKAVVEGLHAHYSVIHARGSLGFEFSEAEAAKLPSAVHPLIFDLPRVNRRALYLSQHASHIVEWPVPEGRVFLYGLTEHATQERFVYNHDWHKDDLVIWDNNATLHRGKPYDDATHKRDLRRTVTKPRVH
jgi:alpha-ketoglutarate-dependent 2,4-dichlorophenoxyacetate dioxygenase